MKNKDNLSSININSLDKNKQINYIKKMLFSENINDAIDYIIKNEKKDLNLISILIKCLDDNTILNKIENENNLNSHETKLYVYSRILAFLEFYNKKVILNKFFLNLSDKTLKDIAIYE